MQDIIKLIEYNQYNLPFIIEMIAVYILILWLAVVAWVLRDITTRSQNFLVIMFSVSFVLIGNLPALILYLLLRPEKTLDENKSVDLFYASVLDKDVSICHSCQTLIRNDYKFCPSCAVSVEKLCPGCDAKVNPLWKYCTNCNYNLSPDSYIFGKIKNFQKHIINSIDFIKKVIVNISLLIVKLIVFVTTLPFRVILGVTKFIGNKLNIKIGFKFSNIKLLQRISARFPKFKVQLQLPKFSNPLVGLLSKEPKLKTIAEKRHEPKEQTKVVKVKTPDESNSSTKKKKKKGRGRPKGKGDKKPRKKRSDAGKKRGKYKST